MDDDENEEIVLLTRKVENLFERLKTSLENLKIREDEAAYHWTVLERLSEGWHPIYTPPMDEDQKDQVLQWVRSSFDYDSNIRTWSYREHPGGTMSFVFAFRNKVDCAKAKLMIPSR